LLENFVWILWRSESFLEEYHGSSFLIYYLPFGFKCQVIVLKKLTQWVSFLEVSGKRAGIQHELFPKMSLVKPAIFPRSFLVSLRNSFLAVILFFFATVSTWVIIRTDFAQGGFHESAFSAFGILAPGSFGFNNNGDVYFRRPMIPEK